jgi:hypothetical protein
MHDSFRVVAMADQGRCDRLDAAPGIEPTTTTDTIWLLPVDVTSHEGIAWSTDWGALKHYIKRRKYEHYCVRILDRRNQITQNSLASSPSACEYSIEELRVGWELKTVLLQAGLNTLGAIADMSFADFRRLGFNPPEHQLIQRLLAPVGLAMSFDLFPGEKSRWSPKRRSP